MLPIAPTGPAAPAAATASDPTLSFTTTMMISYAPVTVAPGGLAAGDGYVIAGKVTRHGAPDGLSTGTGRGGPDHPGGATD